MVGEITRYQNARIGRVVGSQHVSSFNHLKVDTTPYPQKDLEQSDNEISFIGSSTEDCSEERSSPVFLKSEDESDGNSTKLHGAFKRQESTVSSTSNIVAGIEMSYDALDEVSASLEKQFNHRISNADVIEPEKILFSLYANPTTIM